MEPSTPSAARTDERAVAAAVPVADVQHGFWADRLARDEAAPTTVSVGELVVLGAVLVLGVLATVGLAAAYAGHFGPIVVGAGTVLVLAALGVLLRLAGGMPRVVGDLPGLLVLLGSAAVAGWMFLPGFHYAAGDKDPGGYLMTGAAIAREGSLPFTDPVLAAHLPVAYQSPGARFPGIWVADASRGLIMPQFYHLWSALLAVADRLHGFAGMANADPLVAVLAVLLAVAVARRLGGLVAAGVTGVLLATNMLQVWQAKYPTAEILTQALFMGAVLGLVLAIQTKWRWPAGVAGLLIGMGWLARADGLLLVLLAVGVGSTLWVLRRFDARCWWFAAGLAVIFPFGLYQAYGPTRTYTAAVAIPSRTRVLAVVAGCVLLAVVLRLLVSRVLVLGRLAGWVDRTVASSRCQRRIGLLILVVCLGLFGLEIIRPMFGVDYLSYLGRPIRSYDERSIYWLSWFFTWPGLLLMLAGIGFVMLRRWTPAPWVIVVPTLVFLPIYAWHAKNSPYLMWWGRRYVSTVLPGMVLLIALGIAGLWVLRGRLAVPRRVAAAVLTAFLVAVFAHQSLPLRQHDEWGGTEAIGRHLAALGGGRQGVFLWQPAAYCCAAPTTLLAGPLWLEQDQISVLLPSVQRNIAGYVGAYVRHFTSQPVYLVYERGSPAQLAGLRVTVVRQFAGTLPWWEQSSTHRPNHELQVPYHFTVYQVEPANQ